MPSNRSIAVDIARGGLMFYIVVIIHGIFWLELLPLKMSSILLFEMPLIFIISGYAYGLNSSSPSNPFKTVHPSQLASHTPAYKLFLNQYIQFISTRFLRILLPFFAYALVCACLYMAYVYKKQLGHLSNIDILVDWLNPVTRGKNAHFGYLSSHLWFVPIFLGVTAILPIATKFKLPSQLPTWFYFIAMAGMCYVLSSLKHLIWHELIQVLFYTFWALMGFYIQSGQIKFNLKTHSVILGLSCIYFAQLYLFNQPASSFNIQQNKFPADEQFFIFCSMWVSFILLSLHLIKPLKAHLVLIGSKSWLNPFIAYGYSIYLWQGFAYTAAVSLMKLIGGSHYLAWFLAVSLSILLGRLFSPIERIKIKF